MHVKNTVWIFIQENCLPEDGPHNRWAFLGKHLSRMGYRVVVFAGSVQRHMNRQAITDGSDFLVDESLGFPFVYVRVSEYAESMKRRLVAIGQFHVRLSKLCRTFVNTYGKPDIIVGSSCYPLSPTLAIRKARKYDAASICETRDLWPLSLEDYGIIPRGGFIARMMYRLEKYNYENADALVFTMEGGADYIKDREWDIASGGRINLEKVFHVNNGVDLETYAKDVSEHDCCLDGLLAESTANIIYAGSISRVNDLGFLLGVAQILPNDIQIVIAGDGTERLELEDRAIRDNISNVTFLGELPKKSIPSLLSQGNILLMYSKNQSDLSKYGMSQNKLFDYLASGKPVISNLPSNYSIVNRYKCGIEESFDSQRKLAERIMEMLSDEEALQEMGERSRDASRDYDYANHARKLVEVIAYAQNAYASKVKRGRNR